MLARPPSDMLAVGLAAWSAGGGPDNQTTAAALYDDLDETKLDRMASARPHLAASKALQRCGSAPVRPAGRDASVTRRWWQAILLGHGMQPAPPHLDPPSEPQQQRQSFGTAHLPGASMMPMPTYLPYNFKLDYALPMDLLSHNMQARAAVVCTQADWLEER